MTHHQDIVQGSWPVVFWTWFCVGISQMTPLQVVQFIGALCAIALTLRQFYLSFKTKRRFRESERMGLDSRPHHHSE